MNTNLELMVIPAQELMPADKKSIQDLCVRAFGDDVWCDYEYLHTAFHVIGRHGDKIVSHALWTDRCLSIAGFDALKTAYVEYVATEPSMQGQGLASQLLRFLIHSIQNEHVFHMKLHSDEPYQFAALAPENSDFYQRLGWELWLGNLFIRQDGERVATPDDDVMVYRLPQSPKYSVTDSLSAEWREGELW